MQHFATSKVRSRFSEVGCVLHLRGFGKAGRTRPHPARTLPAPWPDVVGSAPVSVRSHLATLLHVLGVHSS